MMLRVAIIGAGPSGLAMAIQLKRYGIEPVVYEGHQAGGLLWNANLVENYPGFPGGIRGSELVRLFVDQSRESGVKIVYEEVTSLDYKEGVFILRCGQKRYQYQRVAVASGTKPIQAAIADLPAGAEKMVLYEVFPLLSEKWKKIVIVGAGDAAFDYALNLAWQNEVTILNRGSARGCLPLLYDRVYDHPNITYYQNIGISQVELDEPVRRLTLTCTSPAGMRKIVTDYLIYAIGRVPRIDFISENLIQFQGELIDSGRLYLIGDVKNDIYRQTAIATGDGVLAAMKLYRTGSERGD
jgi:thioredoxin reductase (NADPH)